MRKTLSAALIAATLGLGMTAVPALAAKEQHHAAKESDRLLAALNTRIATVEAKLTDARKAGRVTPAQAAQTKKQLVRMRTEAKGYARQQGFLSAGESASYNRTLDDIQATLG